MKSLFNHHYDTSSRHFAIHLHKHSVILPYLCLSLSACIHFATFTHWHASFIIITLLFTIVFTRKTIEECQQHISSSRDIHFASSYRKNIFLSLFLLLNEKSIYLHLCCCVENCVINIGFTFIALHSSVQSARESEWVREKKEEICIQCSFQCKFIELVRICVHAPSAIRKPPFTDFNCDA